MKKIILILMSVTLSFVSLPSFAASQAACAIWLCLPAGFPSPSCNSAKSAFKHRIKHGHSPLPGLSGCLASDSTSSVTLTDGTVVSASNVTSETGTMSYVPAWRKCLRWETSGSDHSVYITTCEEWIYFPNRLYKGTGCGKTETGYYPTKCYKNIRYAETFLDGESAGIFYYYYPSGTTYTPGDDVEVWEY